MQRAVFAVMMSMALCGISIPPFINRGGDDATHSGKIKSSLVEECGKSRKSVPSEHVQGKG